LKTNSPSVTRNLAAAFSPFNLRPGEVDPLKRARDKVAILGTGNNRGAPWQDPEWEIWGLNNMRCGYAFAAEQYSSSMGASYFRADRWFELHPRSVCDDDRAVTDQLQAMTYVVDETEWPERNLFTVYSFPRAMALAQGRNYFASTFSWQVAFALALGYQEIGLWGVQLWAGREGVVERASLNYWLGVAEGRGVKVTLAPDCLLLWHPAEYGLDYWKELEHVGRWVHWVKPTLREVPERPPGKRPPESYRLERAARDEYDKAMAPKLTRWQQILEYLSL